MEIQISEHVCRVLHWHTQKAQSKRWAKISLGCCTQSKYLRWVSLHPKQKISRTLQSSNSACLDAFLTALAVWAQLSFPLLQSFYIVYMYIIYPHFQLCKSLFMTCSCDHSPNHKEKLVLEQISAGDIHTQKTLQQDKGYSAGAPTPKSVPSEGGKGHCHRDWQ